MPGASEDLVDLRMDEFVFQHAAMKQETPPVAQGFRFGDIVIP
jgi:hypothetical protein